jgi:hypothetical protein
VFGFNSVWPGPNISAAELMALNTATITYQESSLSFDFSPNYKYVNFQITRIVVTPEPTSLFISCAACLGMPWDATVCKAALVVMRLDVAMRDFVAARHCPVRHSKLSVLGRGMRITVDNGRCNLPLFLPAVSCDNHAL